MKLHPLFSFVPLLGLLLCGPSPLAAKEAALQQATIKGLLVVELDNGGVAGTVSQMNATLVRGSSDKFSIGFNQDVGEMMEKATVEVEKFIRVRHGDELPLGKKVELAFADKYSPKDGPSAAVVCALLTDSIVTGDEIDPEFAATGDMTATGQIRPIGGLTGKIRGAIKRKCQLLGAPKLNEQSINDIYVDEGPESLYRIQIFTLSTFEEAREVAMMKRSPEMQKAIDEFAQIQKVLLRDSSFLRNKKVQEKLRQVVKLAPNHASARLLYLHAIGKGPKELSLPGSLNAIDRASATFSIMLQDGSYEVDGGGQDDVLGELVNDIARLRPNLDPRTRPYCDSYDKFAAFVKDIRSRNRLMPSERKQIDTMLNRITSERNKLLNNNEVREELMLE